jgi:NAD(P)-dependent dehydrogenase (short-subunit alcohol dehydrogenase family)
MGKLTGKVAVITGGSSGIGLATAAKFVDEGADVFITGRRKTELDKAVRKIGRNVTAVEGDVANLADLDRLYSTMKDQKGSLDIVVANAAFVELVTFANVTPEHFDQTFNVNALHSSLFRKPFHSSRTVARSCWYRPLAILREFLFTRRIRRQRQPYGRSRAVGRPNSRTGAFV